ncbi:MAG: hypothetical protein B6I26_03845 [Desulfobacteraceae bacterium 4572_130]|nr:MAG: hypothetical protein B6I26_03845 [Desulfobacteraceae bacterium 4572_130]
MKAIFKNIGPINKAELKLKDLTIIAGANNTGKTYLAYTLYGLLKLVKQPLFLVDKVKNKDLPFDLNLVVKEILDTGKSECIIEDFNNTIKKSIKNMKNILQISDNIISDILSSSTDDSKEAKCFLDPKYLFNKKQKTVGVGKIKLGKNKWNINAFFEKNKLCFNLQNYVSLSIPPQIIEGLILGSFIRIFIQKIPEPFILSAERFGISLFSKELDFTKNRLVEILQKLEGNDSRKKIDPFFLLMEQTSAKYAKPIKDNIDYTRDIEFIQKQQSYFLKNKLFDNIKEILGGYFKYQNGIRFISKARKNGKFDIPLNLASSSARGLSDLYFFLKHKAKKNQLLIIDEPESHLDTSNQIKMAQLLALCVNNGLKVLITTHSDYLIKEFNNLIMLSNDFKDKENFLNSNKQYTKNDYLKPESVGTYVCENGQLTSCNIDNKGMDIKFFDDTIDKINEVSNELDFLIDEQDI